MSGWVPTGTYKNQKKNSMMTESCNICMAICLLESSDSTPGSALHSFFCQTHDLGLGLGDDFTFPNNKDNKNKLRLKLCQAQV